MSDLTKREQSIQDGAKETIAYYINSVAFAIENKLRTTLKQRQKLEKIRASVQQFPDAQDHIILSISIEGTVYGIEVSDDFWRIDEYAHESGDSYTRICHTYNVYDFEYTDEEGDLGDWEDAVMRLVRGAEDDDEHFEEYDNGFSFNIEFND
jgi:hypothetical protein